MKNRVAMIRFVFFLCILFFTFAFNYETVMAGDINLPEADIIEFLKGTFEYNGSTYKVKSQYINKVEEYVTRDDVNLTAEDKSQAISMFYSNMQQGIDEGYVEVISSGNETTQNEESENQQDTTNQTASQNAENSNSTDSGKSDYSSTGEIDNKGENTEKENASNESNTIEESEMEDDFWSLGLDIDIQNESDDKLENSNQLEESSISNDIDQDIDVGENTADASSENNEASGNENDSERENEVQVFQDDNLIKRTGFNMAPVKVLLLILAMIYVILLIVSVKNSIAAKQHDPY